MTVSQDADGRIWLDQVPKGILVEMGAQAERSELVHLEGDSLIPIKADRGIHIPHVFVGDDGRRQGAVPPRRAGDPACRYTVGPATAPAGRRPGRTLTPRARRGTGPQVIHHHATTHDGRRSRH